MTKTTKNNSNDLGEDVAVLKTKVDSIQLSIEKIDKKMDNYINIYTAHPNKCRHEFDSIYATKEEVHYLRQHIDSQFGDIKKALTRQDNLLEKYGWKLATLVGIVGIATKQIGLW
jgi:hypothetical protein